MPTNDTAYQSHHTVYGILLISGLILITVSALSELRGSAWWIRIWDFPRHHIAFLAVLVALGLVWLGNWNPLSLGVIAGLCGTVGYQMWRISPHVPLGQPEVMTATGKESSGQLSIITANVQQHNRSADAFISLVREYDPDVVVAIETDEWWETALAELEESYPHAISYPLDTTYGIILLSRLPLVQPQVQFLVESDTPSIHTFVRLRNGALVWLRALHPDPPYPRYAAETTERDAELLIAGREVAKHEGPAVMVGDFNDVSWSPTTQLFRRISGLLDPRVGRGFYNTYNADWPLFRWPIDHVFHSKHFHLRHLERGPYFGSDHFPMYVKLELDPEAPLEQWEPETSENDQKETTRKILDAR